MSFDVSVVIPVHNGLPDLLDAVQSALAQTQPAREIVIVDDRSTDGGAEAVEHAFSKLAGPQERTRLRVMRGTFGSAAAARNAGCRATRSEWIAFLDADDLWFEDKLAAAEQAIAAAPGAAWFFSDGAFRTLGGDMSLSWFEAYAELPEKWIGQPVRELIAVNFILTSSVVVRREVLEATGGFDESLSHAEDADLWIRLARRWPATASRRALVRYQHRAGGLTRQIAARLLGDVAVFERLALDPSLAPRLRGNARRRAALAHFKLGVLALREERRVEARRHLAVAWRSPAHWPGVALTSAVSWLPGPLLAWLRRRDWALRVAGPMKRVRRVRLHRGPRVRAEASAVPGSE